MNPKLDDRTDARSRHSSGDVQIAKTVIVLALLTLCIPLFAAIWLVLLSPGAMPQPLGVARLPSWVGWFPVPEPQSFLTMLGALGVLVAAAAVPAVLSSLAKHLAVKLRSQDAQLLSGTLVTARAVARVSAMATLLVACLFITASAAALLGPRLSALGTTWPSGADEEYAGSADEDGGDGALIADTAEGDAAYALTRVTPEQRQGVLALAESTMALIPTAEYVRDSAGTEPLLVTATTCGAGDEAGVAVNVTSYFQTDGTAFDGEAVRALWAEHPLVVRGTMSEIIGESESASNVRFAILYYDTDGVYVLSLSGACRALE
ncbi:hypothetical protein C5E06_13730 [Pseudoclavibacter sp. RFBI5]|nr:hypothetical protein C5E06_13730 [Pseudoclavibacter sp. RFBI5]